MTTQVVTESTITCPHCGFSRLEIMPTEACQIRYSCPACAEVLKPRAGDCCVFCSYGTVPCPPIQVDRSACGPPLS